MAFLDFKDRGIGKMIVMRMAYDNLSINRVLYIMVENYGIGVVAYTVNNWYIRDIARPRGKSSVA